METPISVTRTERVDDIPLLLAQMDRMGIAALLDKHFPMHGNWQGPGLGQIVVVWLAYLLSEGDHRLNSVQGWAAGILLTLALCLKADGLRGLDFSDDRLAVVLERLGHDADWEGYESEQGGVLLRVYDLQARRVRVDSSTAKSHVAVTEDGLFQFGHSKERRPDLPQLKISLSALDPPGMPLTTTVVSGERADDPLYVPEIRKVQDCLGRHGVLYVGDCKMAALATRAYVAAHRDYYLCPLPAVQMPKAALAALLGPVWAGGRALEPVRRPAEKETGEPGHIADGFAYAVTLAADCEGSRVEWQEQRLVARSLKQAASQEKALEARLGKAEQAIAGLNRRGRGRKCLDEDGLRGAADALLEKHGVAGLLAVEIARETRAAHKRAYGKRAAETVTAATFAASASRDAAACAEAVRGLGWRVFACNDPGLGLAEAVLAYREEYLVERGFNRLRGKTLGLTPLFLSSTTRIKGLVRLLGIALRVLCLVEFAVRKALQEEGAKLDGIYAGNPKRATARPTTEMMLVAFRGLYLNVVSSDGTDRCCMTPLNAVQTRILGLIGFPPTIYQGLEIQSGKLGVKMGEP